MKKLNKLAMGFLLLAVMIFVNTGIVFAEGTTTIYLSTNDPIGVGDSISITIKASDSAPIKVLYTDSILGFVSCSNDSYSTSGNSITFTGKEATIKFSGAAEGKANVIVSSEVLTGSSAQVTVTGSGNAPAQEAAPEENTEEAPAEQTEEVAETTGEAATLSGEAVGPITVGTPDTVLSSQLMETTLVLEDGATVPAYRLQNTESDFYYVYGMTEDGNGAWYSYDNANHTLQRADTTLFTSLVATEDGEVASGEDTAVAAEEGESLKERAQRLYKNRVFLVILLFVVLIGLIVFFNIRMKMRDDEYDDDEDDFFEEYGEAQARREAIENSKETRAEPKVRTVVAGKEEPVKKDVEEPTVDLSAALEETVLKTENIDLSDAIVKQVTKPSKKKDEDDLHIIDFNDL